MATIQLDDFGTIALERYNALVSEYNALVKAAKGVESKEEFEKQFMTEAPELAEFNAKIEKLESALETLMAQRLAAATPLIEPAYQAAVANSGVDIPALDAKLKDVKATKKYLEQVYGPEATEGTEKVESRGKVGGASTGSSGGRRIRGVEVYVDGKLASMENKEGKVVSNFSIAAKVVGVETVALQRAFFDAAGSEDVRSDEFPAIVDFELNDHKVRGVKLDDSADDSEQE
jgi:hypothetical protein